MGSSQNKPQDVQCKQGPDILLALRESLIQDPRIGTIPVHADRHDDAAQNGFHQASSLSAAKPSIDLNREQTRLQSDDSPSIAPTQPSIELNPQQASLQSDQISSDRPPVERRVFFTLARGFIVIAVVGGVALLSYGGDKKRDIVGAWNLSLHWLSSVLRTNSSQGPDTAGLSVSKPLGPAPPQNIALLPVAPGSQAAPASVAPRSSSESQYLLETMTSDLAVVRRLVDELATREDQMARDIAKERDVAKHIVRAWHLSLNWLSSVLHTNSSQGPDIAALSVSQPLGPTPSQNMALLPAAPGIQSAPASGGSGSSPQSQYLLETMTSDLAVVRRLMEQLAARQDQMANEIATLQAVEQNLSQKISSLPQSPTIRIPRKKVVKSAEKWQ
jgi:hypothetical protein